MVLWGRSAGECADGDSHIVEQGVARGGVSTAMGYQAVDVADVLGEEPPEGDHVVVGPVSSGDRGDCLRVYGWRVGAGWRCRRRLVQGEQAEGSDDATRGVPGYDQVDFYHGMPRLVSVGMSGIPGGEARERRWFLRRAGFPPGSPIVMPA